MAIERYEGTELSIDRAARRLPASCRDDYLAAYEWLIDDAGATGARPFGTHAPEGVTLKLAAQRGIHKPSGLPYALTISSAQNDTYAKDAVHELGDGTWLLHYCAHHRNSGKREASPEYNKSLRRCLRDGMPVGVFVKDGTTWRHMGLAFVESYDSALDMFLLHGPVGHETGSTLSPCPTIEYHGARQGAQGERELLGIAEKLPPESDERDHVMAEVVRRKGQAEFRHGLLEAYQGKCAISGYDAEPALEAAHISSYLGPQSQLVTNGLLLRADLHTLYDRFLLTVTPDLVVRMSPKLLSTRYAYLDGSRLTPPRDPSLRPSEQRLCAQYEVFLAANDLGA